jgi:CTP synthase
VIGVHDMETIYQVPLLLHSQGLLQRLQKGLALDKLTLAPDTVAKGGSLWELWKKTIGVPKDSAPVQIALVGKYTQLMDSYTSVVSFDLLSSFLSVVKPNPSWLSFHLDAL